MMTKRRINDNTHQCDMPEDIIMNEILVWLPVSSLLRFKSVCKSWYSLIQSSEFVSKHLLHHHYHHPTSEDDFFITLTPEGKALLFPRNANGTESSENYNLSDIPHPYEKDDEDEELMIPASFNGIIFLYDQDRLGSQHSYLWNPATKQCRLLPHKKWPQNLSVFDRFSIQFAIGFDDKTNDYKVVRLVIVHEYRSNNRKINNDCQLDIYSLTTDSWSAREDVVLPVVPVRRIIDSIKTPFHNGKYFCWLGEIDQTEENFTNIIISFDFSNDVLGTMPLPESVICSYNKCLPMNTNMTIATLRDKLVCIDRLRDSLGDSFDIWILNEFGVKESWNKLYTIGKFQILDYYGWYYWLRGIPNNQELIFELRDEKIRLCNPITGTCQVLNNIRLPNQCLLSLMFKESLVSIQTHNVIHTHNTDCTTCEL
ncbi:F-box protein [Thalictrum thalictroides]|uniref:F-box protein n=1 Tax=Thalictrum thalictroides TaxID=46969 RepID=A0A7J6XE36_THATH|nr:F-box protein [Thalictrum thalictroides]